MRSLWLPFAFALLAATVMFVILLLVWHIFAPVLPSLVMSLIAYLAGTSSTMIGWEIGKCISKSRGM
jgi:uncharacterized membrane protein YccC